MPDAAPQTPPTELCTDKLSKAFDEHVVLNEVCLTVRSGEMVCVVGASGSGKTVLLDHLIGLIQPDSGRVLAADHNALEDGRPPLRDLGELSEDEIDLIRLHWAVVFQKNALFSGSVRENLAFWLREHTTISVEEIDKRSREALQSVALDVNDVIDKDRDALSGGMAKRVAIARAIACDPLVMFYDEPTTGLDPMVSATVHELIYALHHKPAGEGFVFRDLDGQKPAGRVNARRTTIIVTHDRELLRRIRPRVVMLHEAEICFDGTYEQFEKSDLEAARAYLANMPVLHSREAHSHTHRRFGSSP
jgi:phospholipid/cholesterol/gamma-HCH transport system ATP-binding protein